MTDTAIKPDLGRFGVWIGGPVTPDEAVEIEKMGYGAVWPGSPDADLSFVEPILGATESLQIATGIVNIWKSPADQVAESYHRIEDAYPGRFLLGIGVGHPEAIDRYRKPYDGWLVEYLDKLDAAAVPTSRHACHCCARTQSAATLQGPQRRRTPVSDHPGTHGPGPPGDRTHDLPRAGTQSGADH